MSAEILREAAALMRSRAEKATLDICPEWTRGAVRHISRNCEIECHHDAADPLLDRFEHDDGGSWNTWSRYDDAEHIASWHPAVALAVADWIDSHARDLAAAGGHLPSCDSPGDVESALAVALAYLGRSA